MRGGIDDEDAESDIEEPFHPDPEQEPPEPEEEFGEPQRPRAVTPAILRCSEGKRALR